MNRRLFFAALPAALVAGCGFHLRRLGGLPFASLYVDAPAGNTVAERMRTLLRSENKALLAATAGEAEAVLKLSAEEQTKTILSLSGAGRVTEYRLAMRLTYSVSDRNERVLTEPESIELSRDLTYDASQVLAKGSEEQLLYRDMEESAALRILRRLQSLKPGTPP